MFLQDTPYLSEKRGIAAELCAAYKESPTHKQAHLVFADLSAEQAGTQSNAEKPKELFFANARTELAIFETDKTALKINGQEGYAHSTSSG